MMLCRSGQQGCGRHGIIGRRWSTTTATLVVAGMLVWVLVSSDSSSLLRLMEYRDCGVNTMNKPRAQPKKCPRHPGIDDTIHIVTSCDQGAYTPLVTLATSIVLNTRSKVKFHFITRGPQAANLSKIIKHSALYNISYQIVPFNTARVQDKFVVRSARADLANPLNFARFYLPELLPCLERVAYIDVDCLVLGDVKDLYNMKIHGNNVVSGLREPNKFARTLFNFANPKLHKSGIKRTTNIMSAGVFVANLTRWRQQDITEQLDYWMKLNVGNPVVKYSGNGAGSQAIMLLVLHDKYSPLPLHWNVLYANQTGSTAGQKLLHWNGRNKPWKTKSAPNAAVWNKYFKLTKAKFLSTSVNDW